MLSLRANAGRLAERIVASAAERARLRTLLLGDPTLLTPADQQLLRAHLFIDPEDAWLPSASLDDILEYRQRRLERAERDFVLGLGRPWSSSRPGTVPGPA